MTIAAPDAKGNLAAGAIGTGIVVFCNRNRARIVTCRHVAVPHLAVSARCELGTTPETWVSFSDGREAKGRVRWLAEPPLDVAVIEVAVSSPPRAAAISNGTESVDSGTPVLFVPNPLRAGWLIHRGTVTRREFHATPAGDYSLLYTTLPVQPGDSGSGLFDAELRLIGLNTWRWGSDAAPEGIGLPSEAMGAIHRAIEEDRMQSLGRDEGVGPR